MPRFNPPVPKQWVLQVCESVCVRVWGGEVLGLEGMGGDHLAPEWPFLSGLTKEKG